ncbi:response regulator transcription factor [Spirochaeta africana]|uniref:Response regulator containing a CheY-like receiver domain and an HTH DNA-binding domain n=1 Tax=Spirochaeta africana (strain ATCC 700263 / DSM 8902 / Z-7692) TaxID=889378 RepID=H9UFP4_SPIAZ|nr:helix-turn-helix transcriptional regulator [Spirochaeta africana]AFG36337.1 response regulator containing a CheY-like receiver domain and an HTH DNA-binding domain [Spirochaeta africana DSM 8902]
MKALLLHNGHQETKYLWRTALAGGLPVVSATSMDEAIQIISSQSDIEAVIAPLHLDTHCSGLQLARELNSRFQTISLLVHSNGAARDQECADGVISENFVHAYIHPHIDAFHLRRLIDTLLQLHCLHRRAVQLEKNLATANHQLQLFETILDSIATPVAQLNPDLQVVQLNSTGYEMFGGKELSHGRTLYQLLGRDSCWPGYPAMDGMATRRKISRVLYIPELGMRIRVTALPQLNPDGDCTCVYEIWEQTAAANINRTQSLLNRSTENHLDCKHTEIFLTRITNREWDVIPLLVQGRSYEQIATQLGLSVNTVKTHISSIYRKTGAHTRTQLLRLLHNLCP